MKIVPKLTIALAAGTCIIFAVNAYLRVRHDVEFFEASRVRDHELIGRSLGASVTAVWKSDGEASAMASIAAASANFHRIRIRWVSDPMIATPALQPVTRVERAANESRWYTYVPVDVGGARRGSIELYEPGVAEAMFTRHEITDAIAMALALAVLSTALAFLLGHWLVGVPVRRLIVKARRIGLGDLSGPVMLGRNDELGALAVEMNAMAERLDATLDQLRHADRLTTIGKLASGVAHELGTPLNVISARAAMIQRTTAIDDAHGYARIIDEATKRMTNIIRQLLQFARREGPKKSPRELRALVRETLELLAPLAHKRGVRMSLAACDDDTALAMDASTMQQVVTNLVINAVQATPRGKEIEIAIRAVRATAPSEIGGAEGPCVCMEITDHGEGIAPHVLPHVFEPFFTTKDVGEGTGLGLAVAFGIVRDHGGWLVAESKPGEGATFSMFLPKS